MVSVFKRFVLERIPILKRIFIFIKHTVKLELSRIRIRKLINKDQEIWLEVGAGDKAGINGWITLDITKRCDIYWDLRLGLPFPNESVSQIYSSHFMEHLSFREGQEFLDECLRVLVPGGLFSICVPDAKLYIEAYIHGDTLESNQAFRYKPAYNGTTSIDYVNYIAYMDGHHNYMFDLENLFHILEEKGFENVRPRKYDPTLDLQERDYVSIYAQAEKPRSLPEPV